MLKHQLIWSLILFSCLHISCNSSKKESHPNIIIINVDDMGWRDVGFMGSQYYYTPHIDQLASQGMVFTNGYAAASNCAPSRACMMTGKWSSRHGVFTVGNSERGDSKHRKIVPQKNTVFLSQTHEVMPEVFQKKWLYHLS
jgi:arylsulfatase A-like enzyme